MASKKDCRRGDVRDKTPVPRCCDSTLMIHTVSTQPQHSLKISVRVYNSQLKYLTLLFNRVEINHRDTRGWVS